MALVTQIDWRMQRGPEWWACTDTPIWVEMYRDDTLLGRTSVDPPYQWSVGDPDAIEFPEGVRGHLRVRVVAKGDETWERVDIVSTVHAGEAHHVPGPTGSFHWLPFSEAFDFTLDVVPSTDASEGFQNWTLSY